MIDMVLMVLNVLCFLTAAVVFVTNGRLMHRLLVLVNSVPLPAHLSTTRLSIALARVTAFIMFAFIASAVWGTRAFIDILRGV